MKKEKKEMIRNLLYSFCIHLLFLLIMVFANDINELFNKKIVSINSLNINSDFLSKNEIKTTEDDLYPDLTLNEKIELYNIAKNSGYDADSNDSDVVSNNVDIKDIIKTIESSDYILYLGPTDYKRYMNRLNEEEKAKIAKLEAEEKVKLDEIISDLAEDSDIKTGNNTIANNTTITKTKNKVNNKKVVNKKKVNINPDKIFTKSDIEQIKEIIEKETQAQSMLSYRERLNIQNQLIACYKNALIQTGIPSKVPVSVTIKLFPNGIIDTKEIHFKIIDNENRFSTKDYDNTINNAKIALAYCNPLRNMPQNKYSSWQNINFIFDVIK